MGLIAVFVLSAVPAADLPLGVAAFGPIDPQHGRTLAAVAIAMRGRFAGVAVFRWGLTVPEQTGAPRIAPTRRCGVTGRSGGRESAGRT